MANSTADHGEGLRRPRVGRWKTHRLASIPCSRSRPNQTGNGKTSKNPLAIAAGGRSMLKWAAPRAWSGSGLNPYGKCRINEVI
jgi:hypothetical protein